MPTHRYMEEIGSATVLASKRSAGVAPEVNHGEHVTHTHTPSANKVALSGFEAQRRYHQKFKTGVSVARQKEHVHTKILKKRMWMTSTNLII